ncbi:MAG: dehydrogenase [Herbinix sp.]|jgi:predicted dehydrogenase|nr:dehydrogenase [Herbinix sp.]
MIKFATIGTSKITRKLMEVAKDCDDFKLVAVYSREKATAESFGKEYGAEIYFDHLDDLEKCTSVDAVYIASPNSLHYDQAIQLLRSGKHVLCEKAMGSNAKEVDTMLQVAKENNVLLLEAMRSLFDPGQRLIKDNLYKLGTIRRATINYCQYSSRYDGFKRGERTNIFDGNLSAGALMDIGVYCVHSLIDLFGSPNEVSASSVFLANGIDGAGSILAKYDTMIAEVIYSKITNSYLPSEIQGEAGVMLISDAPNPRKITIRYNDNSEEIIEVEPCENNMVYELRAFMKAIETKKEMSRFHEVSLEAMKLMDQVRSQIGVKFPADYRVEFMK